MTSTNTNHTSPLIVVPGNLIDQSGLSSTPVTLANIGSVLHSDGVATDIWRGHSSALPITLTFDFASTQTIDYVGMWQGFGDREGTGGFTLSFWDGVGGLGTQVGSDFTDFLDPIASTVIPLNGRSFDVGTRAGVRSFTMEITSIADFFNPFVHLGEVMVATNNMQAVPEPSTIAIWSLLGLVGAGVQRRRRNRAA